jgi:hypothetical protein
MQSLAQIFRYPTNIVLAASAWGGASALIDGFVIPQIKDGSSALLQILDIFVVTGSLLILVLWVGCVILLFRMKWKHALAYFVAGCVLCVSAVAPSALEGDRLAGAHREIAEIYALRRSGFAPDKQQFFNLGETCHPPGECNCWLLWDPNHSSPIDADLGRWHTPMTNFFLQDSGFEIVDVRRIDSNAISVLGC